MLFRSRLRYLFVAAVCLIFIGCVRTAAQKYPDSAKETAPYRSHLSKKDAEIKRLQELLIEKEKQLKEKDEKIEELKTKLRLFGVF